MYSLHNLAPTVQSYSHPLLHLSPIPYLILLLPSPLFNPHPVPKLPPCNPPAPSTQSYSHSLPYLISTLNSLV